MKLRVQPGPLPMKPPYFEWEDEDFESDVIESEDEIDLTDLLDPDPFERPEMN